MGKNLISFGNLRNQTLYTSKEAAIAGIQAEGTNDGVIKLGRYTDGNLVRTIFGIAYTNGSSTSYTIYESFKEVIDDLQAQIDAITGGEGSIATQIKAAIDALKGDVTEDYDTLGEIEAIIKQNKIDGVVTLESAEGQGEINKVYTFKQGGVEFGHIDIYKDSFLKTVQLIDADGHVIDEEHPGVAKYIQFIFVTADGSENVVNVPISSFIQDLEAGDGLIVDANGKLNVVKDQSSEDFLEIYEDSIAIVGVQDAIDAAIATLNSELRAALAEEKARAEAAEAALDEKIEAEKARAIAEETRIESKLDAETERAEIAEGVLLDEINKIEIVGTYGVSAKTDNNRVTTLKAVVGDFTPFIDESPLSVVSSGIKFADKLDCGYYDVVKVLNANSSSDLTYLGSYDVDMKMTTDIDGRIGYGIFANTTSSLNINGKTFTQTGATSSFPTVLVRGSANLTFSDSSSKKLGKVVNASSQSPVVWNSGTGTITIDGGNYISEGAHTEVIYCEKGIIEINGGTFRTTETSDNRYILNCKDANYKNGTANIVVKGGKFYNFNPQDCASEGEHTNFVAEGYHSVQLENETIDEIEYTVFEVVADE